MSLIWWQLLYVCHIGVCDGIGFSDAKRSHAIALFVGQIPLLTTDEELKARFPGCLTATVVKNKHTGLSKG